VPARQPRLRRGDRGEVGGPGRVTGGYVAGDDCWGGCLRGGPGDGCHTRSSWKNLVYVCVCVDQEIAEMCLNIDPFVTTAR
jgi:hypothetical protein